MKRILAALLSALVIAGFAACGSNNAATDNTDTEVENVETSDDADDADDAEELEAVDGDLIPVFDTPEGYTQLSEYPVYTYQYTEGEDLRTIAVIPVETDEMALALAEQSAEAMEEYLSEFGEDVDISYVTVAGYNGLKVSMTSPGAAGNVTVLYQVQVDSWLLNISADAAEAIIDDASADIEAIIASVRFEAAAEETVGVVDTEEGVEVEVAVDDAEELADEAPVEAADDEEEAA